MIENVRALARGTTRAINLDDTVPPEAVQAIEELAAGVRALKDYLEGGDPEPARAAAVRAAGLANAVLETTGNLSAVHIVGQIRLAAVDLLRAAGLPRDEAQEAVRNARLADLPMVVVAPEAEHLAESGGSRGSSRRCRRGHRSPRRRGSPALRSAPFRANRPGGS